MSLPDVRLALGRCRRALATHHAAHCSWALARIVFAGALALPGSMTAIAEDLEARRVAPYAVTPYGISDEMLRLARVGPADYVVDLGSGDGRLVIRAVTEFGARGGFGVDISEKLVAYANASAAQAGVADRVHFDTRDLFTTDIGDATVVTLYLFPAVMRRVGDKLAAELRAGTRVVSHDFPLPGWPIERVSTFAAPEKNDTTGRNDAVLFLYTVRGRTPAR